MLENDYEKEISILKGKVEELIKEKEQSEKDFGFQRAKFIDLFKQKEDELNAVKSENNLLTEKVSILEKDKNDLTIKIDEAAIMSFKKDDEIVKIQQKYQEESASFQHILRESVDQAYEKAASQFEKEKTQLLKASQQFQEIKSKTISDASEQNPLSSLARNLQKRMNLLKKEASDPQDSNVVKAQEEFDFLKSVVTPLEEEIERLKFELTSKTHQLFTSSKQDKTQSEEVLVSDAKTKELNQSMQSERASRTDLEMYVNVLNIQKDVLKTDYDRLKVQLENAEKQLEKEKIKVDYLKDHVTLLNEYLNKLNELISLDDDKINQLINIHESQFKEKLADFKENDKKRKEIEKKINEINEKRKNEVLNIDKLLVELNEEFKELSSIGTSTSVSSENLTEFSLVQNLTPSTTHNQQQNNDLQQNQQQQQLIGETIISETIQDQHLNQGPHEIIKKELINTLNSQFSSPSPLSKKTPREFNSSVSPDNNLTSKPYNNSLTDHHNNHAPSAPTNCISLPSHQRSDIVVSEEELKELQIEMNAAKDKLVKSCSNCHQMSERNQTLLESEKKLQFQIRTLIKQLDLIRETVDSRDSYIKELEGSLQTVMESFDIKIINLNTKIGESEGFMRSFKDHFEKTKMEMFDYLKSFATDRNEIQKELTKLQNENESLVDKHTKSAQELQEEVINLPNNLEDMQLLLLKFREDLIKCKVTLEHQRYNWKNEIDFLKSRLESEQQERLMMEDTLTQELSQLQNKIDNNRQTSQELDKERMMRVEEEDKRRKMEEILLKTSKSNEAFQFEIKQLQTVKSKLERTISELRSKVQSLQIDLDNSEEVQKDFVKLSQTLQIQLEKIRAAEAEVRWQYEEDVHQCPSCKGTFAGHKKKTHCRHCGQIFCQDCLRKSVTSGPSQRTSRVCDVCHTMLVKTATPFFSNNNNNNDHDSHGAA